MYVLLCILYTRAKVCQAYSVHIHVVLMHTCIHYRSCTNTHLQRCESSLQNQELHCLGPLYQRITQLSLLHKDTENTRRLSSAANVVLYHLSGLHFHGIFNKIILRYSLSLSLSLSLSPPPLSLPLPPSILSLCLSRVTSWNRVTPLTGSSQSGSSSSGAPTEAPETDDLHVIGLIPHLNLDAARLQQILQG